MTNILRLLSKISYENVEQLLITNSNFFLSFFLSRILKSRKCPMIQKKINRRVDEWTITIVQHAAVPSNNQVSI